MNGAISLLIPLYHIPYTSILFPAIRTAMNL